MISELGNKEFGIIELITRGWKAFNDNFKSILIIALIINLPCDIFQALLWNKKEHYLLIIWSLLFFAVPAASMAVAVIVEQYILQASAYYPTSSLETIETAFSALKKAFSRFGYFLITGTLIGTLVVLFLVICFIISILAFPLLGIPTSIISILAFPLLVIPSLLFFVNQFFLLEVITLRKYSGVAALSYSKSIVQGRWWKVLFLWIVLIINFYLMDICLTIFLGLITSINPALKLFTEIILQFSLSLILHFHQVVSTIFFLNLEYRKN